MVWMSNWLEALEELVSLCAARSLRQIDVQTIVSIEMPAERASKQTGALDRLFTAGPRTPASGRGL